MGLFDRAFFIWAANDSLKLEFFGSFESRSWRKVLRYVNIVLLLWLRVICECQIEVEYINSSLKEGKMKKDCTSYKLGNGEFFIWRFFWDLLKSNLDLYVIPFNPFNYQGNKIIELEDKIQISPCTYMRNQLNNTLVL